MFFRKYSEICKMVMKKCIFAIERGYTNNHQQAYELGKSI